MSTILFRRDPGIEQGHGPGPDRDVPPAPSHTTAAALALFVVFLWATSWMLIKYGLQEIPPLTFAGIRYSLAALALIGAILLSGRTTALRSIPTSGWRKLALLGVLLYTATQGAVFVALSILPAVTVNLVWSFSTIVVAWMGDRLAGRTSYVAAMVGCRVGDDRHHPLFLPALLAGRPTGRPDGRRRGCSGERRSLDPRETGQPFRPVVTVGGHGSQHGIRRSHPPGDRARTGRCPFDQP